MRRVFRHILGMASVCALASLPASADEPRLDAEQIFPPHERQTHAPAIVECPNGDLIASWYGDREGLGEDSAVFGARRPPGSKVWSEPFILADTPGFADGNTAMSIDTKGRLWLFWPTVIGGSWESCLTNYRVSRDFQGAGSPRWERQGLVLLRPADFREDALSLLGNRELRPPRGAVVGPGGQKAKLSDPLYQRLGWATRCKPTVLPNGRILLPLYSDTFSISIMAISDDEGATWTASKPLLGFGNIQPTVLRRNDGTLVAYMREAGALNRIRVAESRDDGMTWGPVETTSLPNPGSGIDGLRLANGRWILVYNDATDDRARLAVSLSEDEGRTWPITRHLERQPAGRFHYPCVIQGRDGTIHAIYSCFFADPPKPGAKVVFKDKGIKHAAFNEAWIRAGD